jgi:hypothetical protein
VTHGRRGARKNLLPALPSGKVAAESIATRAVVRTKTIAETGAEKMPSVMEQILSHIDENTLHQMSNQLGESPQTTGNGIAAALPVILQALARNAGDGQGRASLYNAVSNDHDGSILGNLASVLGGPMQAQSRATDGAGILGHVFGNSQNGLMSALSQATGMNTPSMGRLVMMLAPVVMGFLGQQSQRQGLNADGLASMLGQERDYAQQSAPGLMGTLTRFLDQNGDGSVVDDLGGMLGQLLTRR